MPENKDYAATGQYVPGLTARKRHCVPGLFFFCIILTVASGCTLNKQWFKSPSTGIIDLYTGPLDHLSAISVGECPMYPSCSQYARIAIKEHGPVIGWFMAFDRLIRCGRDTLNYAPKVPVNGRWRYLDPVIANDFWWRAGKVLPAPLLRQHAKDTKWEVKQMNTNP